jgi:hypothetical protein
MMKLFLALQKEFNRIIPKLFYKVLLTFFAFD